LIDWAKVMFGYDVEVLKQNEMHSFKVLPKRRIVERNFAWMGWSRRLSKDYELCLGCRASVLPSRRNAAAVTAKGTCRDCRHARWHSALNSTARGYFRSFFLLPLAL
jgi:transposase